MQYILHILQLTIYLCSFYLTLVKGKCPFLILVVHVVHVLLYLWPVCLWSSLSMFWFIYRLFDNGLVCKCYGLDCLWFGCVLFGLVGVRRRGSGDPQRGLDEDHWRAERADPGGKPGEQQRKLLYIVIQTLPYKNDAKKQLKEVKRKVTTLGAFSNCLCFTVSKENKTKQVQ